MKYKLIYLIILLTNTTFAQYNYNIDVELYNANKLTFELLDEHIETTHRYIDGNRLKFKSNKNYSQFQIDSIFQLIGIDIYSIFFDKESVESSEKNGGVNCEQSQLICNNQSFSSNSSGFGIQELNATNRGCLGVEHQSSWYYLSIQNGGSLNMTIGPNNAVDDYDFAIWGPFTSATVGVNCPPVGNPIRCSYASTTGPTGLMNVTPNQNSEGVFGDGWVEFLTVNPNEYYLLLIDNFSASNSGYNISWSGTATLGCTPTQLSVELSWFSISKNNYGNSLVWKTASEYNSSHFLVEKSSNGEFSENNIIAKITSPGNSSVETIYNYIDTEFSNTLNYYRLIQVDKDGQTITYDPISIDNTILDKKIIKIVNLLGQEVNQNYNGIIIIYYDDNSFEKKFNKKVD